jgi:AraC-like DNA-binding protein
MTTATTLLQGPDGLRPGLSPAVSDAGRPLKRAVRLFLVEEETIRSRFVERIWRSRSVPAESFISVAVSLWEIVVTRQDAGAYVSLRGPETRATISPIPQNAEFVGIQFRPGAFIPHLPAGRLVNSQVDLPERGDGSFWLDNRAWETPSYENAEAFVNALVTDRLLALDPEVEAVAQGNSTGLSPRSLQRRFLRATGLTQGAFRQIERARSAVEQLDRGAPILDVVQRNGYSDQAHLTRSLKLFAGQTPAQIANGRE